MATSKQVSQLMADCYEMGEEDTFDKACQVLRGFEFVFGKVVRQQLHGRVQVQFAWLA